MIVAFLVTFSNRKRSKMVVEKGQNFLASPPFQGGYKGVVFKARRVDKASTVIPNTYYVLKIILTKYWERQVIQNKLSLILKI